MDELRMVRLDLVVVYTRPPNPAHWRRQREKVCLCSPPAPLFRLLGSGEEIAVVIHPT